MVHKPNLTLVVQPQEYFHELVTDAIREVRLKPQPETEFYLVNLLGQFMTTDSLYGQDESGAHKEEPLAFLLKDALEQAEPEAQRALFRHVGDVSLYVAGFFQDSLSRKLVDVDYYINMGGKAYSQVASIVSEDALRALYLELADKFGGFVEVLNVVSEMTTQKDDKNLLRIYEQWIRTKSERAARTLQEAGILPNDSVKKNWQ